MELMTNDYRDEIIRRCEYRRACEDEFPRLKEARTPVEFLRVLVDNASWAVHNSVLHHDEIAREFTPQERLEAGLSDQSNTPLDFTRLVELAGNLWQPLNEEATFNASHRPYFTYDDAIAAHLNTLPTREDFKKLAKVYSRWAYYLGTWGRVFGDKLFLPASGYRHGRVGALLSSGTNGYYWSYTAPAATTPGFAFYLSFNSSGVYPSTNDRCSHGFSVRCIVPKN